MIEWEKALSNKDETKIIKNVSLGEIYLIGDEVKESEVKKAIKCFQNIAEILNSIDAKPKYVKED